MSAIRAARYEDSSIVLEARNSVNVRLSSNNPNVISDRDHDLFWRNAMEENLLRVFIYSLAEEPTFAFNFHLLDDATNSARWSAYPLLAQLPHPAAGVAMPFIGLHIGFKVLRLSSLRSEVLSTNKTMLKILRMAGIQHSGVNKNTNAFEFEISASDGAEYVSRGLDALSPSLKGIVADSLALSAVD
jgi:hypothetical protein